jgi:hypothetical protein
MNKKFCKGFMFSIEMMAVMSIVLLVIVAINSLGNENYNDTKILEIKNFNNATIGIYKMQTPANISPDENKVICKNMADFNSDLNIIIERKYCGWEQ